MARKVGKIIKQKQNKPECPSCQKMMSYVMVMPHKKMQLRCECGKCFNKNLEEIKK